MKQLTTEELQAFARIGKDRGYNRQLSDEIIERLDPNGIHVTSFAMLHEHAGGQKIDPHVRTEVLLKLRGTDDPAWAFMDMDLPMYGTLADITEVETTTAPA